MPNAEIKPAEKFEIPRHVAIIMDGNGRWAAARGLPRAEGHRRGVEALRRTIRAAGELGIGVVTIYSFSSENWSRPLAEVQELMSLLRRFIRNDLAELHRNDIRVRIIGERDGLEPDIARMLSDAEDLTRDNAGLTLVVAFNYGSRQEIARAARKLAIEVAEGRMPAAALTEEALSRFLDAPDIPDPDLVIRTSGEQRLSNFLLWQSAYSELVFLPIYWPDFDRAASRMRSASIASVNGALAVSSRAPGPDRGRCRPRVGDKQSRSENLVSRRPCPARAGAAYFGGWPFAVFWLVASAAILWEWTALAGAGGGRNMFMLGLAAMLLLTLAVLLARPGLAVAILAVAAMVAALVAPRGRRLWMSGGIVYAGAMLLALLVLRRDDALGFAAITLLFAIVWTTDVFGYFVGRAVGGPKLALRISPNKTWSGSLGGTVGGMIAGAIVAHGAGINGVFAVVCIAVVLSVAAQAGDLFESWVKRRFGVKDASQFIPGHGGVMDRLDGFLVAAVIAAAIGVARGGVDASATGLMVW